MGVCTLRGIECSRRLCGKEILVKSHLPRSRTRNVGVLIGILACAAGLEANADSPVSCGVLSAEQVSAIVRKPVRVATAVDSKQGEPTQHCKLVGANVSAEVTVVRATSEHAAAQRYELALRRAPDDRSRDEPLHGVGIESRYRLTEKGSTIIARFGVHVVVVSTNAGRESVVGLARAAGAKVTSR